MKTKVSRVQRFTAGDSLVDSRAIMPAGATLHNWSNKYPLPVVTYQSVFVAVATLAKIFHKEWPGSQGFGTIITIGEAGTCVHRRLGSEFLDEIM
jgi:hypothetical protein